jgi:N-acylneuraminate cytidylyltransferase
MTRRLAVMPARGGSKRIPRKNVAPFAGRPLMLHALEAARRSAMFDTIHVSTEDPAIAAIAAQAGQRPPFLRDPALADDETPLLPVLAWVLSRLAEAGEQFDNVTLVMPTAPLLEPDDLVAAHARFDAGGGSTPVLAVAKFPAPVEWAMRLGPDGRLSPREPGMDQVRSQDLETAWFDTGTFLILPASALAPSAPPPVWTAHELPRWKAVDIDTEDDFRLAEILFRGLGR